jgi:hypothetical protein
MTTDTQPETKERTMWEVIDWRGEVFGTYPTKEEAERNKREGDTIRQK